jgi:hypothetical protein
MMPEFNTMFLRTHSGRIEIAEKACGLTQSERQVLILIDGITPYSGLIQKLERLKADRVARAIDTLSGKGLICEVLLPVEGEGAEELDAGMVERFLHQDPMDPVTIISFHPEDEFGDAVPHEPLPAHSAENVQNDVPPVPVLEEWMAVQPPLPVAPAAEPEANADVVTDEEVAQLAQQVRERHHARPQFTHTVMHLDGVMQTGHAIDTHAMPWRRWEYWLIGTGLILILGGTILR